MHALPIQRLFARWCRAVQRRARSQSVSTAIMVVLSLSLVEPLLCVVHCTFWLSFHQHPTITAVSHQHMAHDHQHAAHSQASHSHSVAVVGPASSAVCAWHGGANDPSHGALAVPFHVMVMPILVLAALVLVVVYLAQWPARTPPPWSPISPLRPPAAS